MGLAKLKSWPEERVELSEVELAIIDHIGQILAEEYVELMKGDVQSPKIQEKEDESSDIR